MLAINPKIKQKAEDIRKKIFGAEVRESLASGLEGMSEDVESIKDRQGNVENQFQDVLDETTDKDVISAPELIAARNGKSNLKTRLDDEHAQVTAQLQHTTNQLEDISINASQFGVKYDGSDERIPMQNAINYCVDNHKKLLISGAVRVEPITHVDGTKVCLYVYIKGATSHSYSEGVEIEFLEGAYLHTTATVECTLLRWKASNSRLTNAALRGVRPYTTLLEVSKYNKTDLSEPDYMCFNKFDDIKFKSAKVAFTMEDQSFYNESNQFSFVNVEKMIHLKRSYAMEQGLVTRASNVNRNYFTNISGNLSIKDGIHVEYGDTNKFTNVSFEGLSGTCIILDSYKATGGYYTEDNTFTNVTFEGTNYQIKDNSESTNYYNVNYSPKSSTFSNVRPRFLLGSLNSAYSPSILHALETTTEHSIRPNLKRWSTYIDSPSGVFARKFGDYKVNADETVSNYDRQAIHITAEECINVATLTRNSNTSTAHAMKLGSRVFFEGKISVTAIDPMAAIQIPLPFSLGPETDIHDFGGIERTFDFMSAGIGSASNTVQVKYRLYPNTNILRIEPPTTGWDSTMNILLINISYFENQ